MITLSERLGALNIEINIQLLANQATIITALGDIVKNGGNEKTLEIIIAGLKDTSAFISRATLKLEGIKKLGVEDVTG